MTSANRVQLTWVKETTPGTTPATPRMRLMRYTKENYEPFKPEFSEGDEINSNRMREDAIKIFEGGGGVIDWNMHFPPNNSPESDLLASGLYNAWTLTPERGNDGTADSVITDIATTNEVVTVTAGGGEPFVAGQLVQISGMAVANNNVVAKCTLGSDTVPRFIGAGLTDEAAPPAAARMKVVGFRGAAADITATASGLGSTLLDFTTLNLAVGMAVKIGNADTAGESFATAALNGWAVISAIATNALTLSNLPTGWTTDAGTGKTISVWFGDYLKNGTLTDATRISGTIEKGFLGQATPTYLAQPGNTVDQLTFSFKHKDKIRVTATLKAAGGTGTQDTTSLDASPDAKTTASNLSANVNFKRLCEGGAALASANRARSLEITVSNNLRDIEDITQAYAAGLNEGDCEVGTKFTTYFGASALLTKFRNGTATSLFTALGKDGQAVSFYVPRQVFRSGNPVAPARNTDVDLPLEGQASEDTTYAALLIINRLEYYK